MLCIRTLEELPEEASTDKESFRFFELKSGIAVPLMIGGKFLGALTLEALEEERDWPEAFVKRFKVLGEILANALDRKASEEKLRRSFAEIKKLKNRLEAENVYFREEIKLQGSFKEIVGQSSAIKYVLFKIEQIAPADTTVLILGETGTGKELVARAIHDKSQPQRPQSHQGQLCRASTDADRRRTLRLRERRLHRGRTEQGRPVRDRPRLHLLSGRDR